MVEREETWPKVEPRRAGDASTNRRFPGHVSASQLLSWHLVPEEPAKIARHFNAGTGWKNVESHRDG